MPVCVGRHPQGICVDTRHTIRSHGGHRAEGGGGLGEGVQGGARIRNGNESKALCSPSFFDLGLGAGARFGNYEFLAMNFHITSQDTIYCQRHGSYPTPFVL